MASDKKSISDGIINIANEIHKPARKNFPRRKVIVCGLGDFQGDLVDLKDYASENDGYKYILMLIDILSKYAYAVPLLRKTGLEVKNALEKIFETGVIPRNLHVDFGTEFYNKNCRTLLEKYKVNLFSTYSHLKASIVERLNRTIKGRMWKQFTIQGNHKWIDIIQDLINNYNDTKHRTINMKPKDVNAENAAEVLETLKKNMNIREPKLRRKKPSFKVDDKIRVSRYKGIFEKGYLPNYSMEIFTIDKVLKTDPYTYKLKDSRGDPILGGFYEPELLKAKETDIFIIDKVIEKNGKRALVKWMGMDDSFNSWTTL